MTTATLAGSRSDHLRLLHAVTSWLFATAILVQAFLAGAAIAGPGGTGDFSPHVEFGYNIVGLAALAVVITAVLAGGARDAARAFGLLVLYIVQISLPVFRSGAPWVAALHPANALLLFGAAVWYATRSTRQWRASRASR